MPTTKKQCKRLIIHAALVPQPAHLNNEDVILGDASAVARHNVGVPHFCQDARLLQQRLERGSIELAMHGPQHGLDRDRQIPVQRAKAGAACQSKGSSVGPKMQRKLRPAV